MKAIAFGLAFATASLFLLPQDRATQQKLSYEELVLFDAANRDRRAQLLHTLKWDEALARAARRHGQLMAEKNTISHQFPGEPDLPMRAREAGASFSQVRENIGESFCADLLHDAWMHSPGHRANVLDPGVDPVGVAVVPGRDGHLFAVEDFARALEALSMEDQEKRVAALLEARGLKQVRTGEDARKSCARNGGSVGSRRPR